MQKNNFAAIVLAAGEGKRMKSPHSKVLHTINGQPMISKTIETLSRANSEKIVVVANLKNLKPLKKLLRKSVEFALQKTPRGTADATEVGLVKVNDFDNIAVLYGDDTAFYKPQTIKNIFEKHIKSSAQITFVTITKNNPKGLGRIVRKNGKLAGIIEEKDASPKQRQIKEINDGLYFFKKDFLLNNLPKLEPSPITGELYLTDLIKIALENKDKVETYKLEDSSQWHGINTPVELAKANLRDNKNIHIMGIYGAGASAVAGIAKSYGFQVSGCDLQNYSAYSQNLNLKVEHGHNSGHLKNISVLITSPAILKFDSRNPEIKKAQDLKIPTITWQEFQGQILQEGKFVIAIAGAFGKSTTTAMISQILINAGFDPTCEVGAKVLEWQQNFYIGKSNYYICEADEYNNNFLNYEPNIAIVLNLSWDHPDFFKSKKDLIAAYQKFVNNIKKDGLLVTDEKSLKYLGSVRKDIMVVKVKDFKPTLSLIGTFRKENANAAITCAQALKIDLKIAHQTIKNFKGLGRRLEFKGGIKGVKFYDDYAVQPYTILKTANALKDKFSDKKVTLILEPHTISRVKKFYNKFKKAILNTKVERVLICDTFLAREKGNPQQFSKQLAQDIGPKAEYSGSIKETVKYLIDSHFESSHIICTMGAGDVYKIFNLIKQNG